MTTTLTYFKKIIFILAISSVFFACKKDDDARQSLRPSIDYTKLTDTVSYSIGNKIFVDAAGKTTLDLKTGNNRYKMLVALNTYNGLALKNTQQLSANVLKNIYSNTSSPFTVDIHADFAVLNASGVQLRNTTASSWPLTASEAIRLKIESNFVDMATISNSVSTMASTGSAGYLSNGTSKYLVDAKGIEIAQVIQKSLIGAYQLDYIANVLLGKGLEADNYILVTGKNYTQLEHNWDEAYATLTLNPIFLKDATDAAKSPNAPESFLGSYVWEYNKTNYSKIHGAFLKGRAAVVNNDAVEYRAQAAFIRKQLEISIAKAALGYLEKWKTSTTDGARAHAIGEGVGFIYSLRFANSFGADAKFSDDILAALISSPNGFWDLTAIKINTASDAIRAKFSL